MSTHLYLKANSANTMEVLSDYDVSAMESVFDQHQRVRVSKLVPCTSGAVPSVFNAESVVANIKEFRKLVSTRYVLEKPINFYAIIRTATPKSVLIEELSKLEDFYPDKNLSNHNSIVRIGNLKNIVFYHCPVFTDIKKYHVDVGLKLGKEIVIQRSSKDGLAITLEYDRDVVKDYRAKDNDKDFSKKKFEEKTTEIIKSKVVDPTSGITLADLERVPNSIPINKLPEKEKDLLKRLVSTTTPVSVKTPTLSVPILSLPPNEIKTIVEKTNALFKNVTIPPYHDNWKKSHLPLEGRELQEEGSVEGTTGDLRQKWKLMEEAQDKAKETKSSYSSSVSLDNYRDVSISLETADYETKSRAFGNVGRGSNLPLKYIDKAKGFYKREERETDKLILLSDESVLVYKTEKMLEFANSFKENTLYDKNEMNNLDTYRTTYVKHQLLHENKIPFILIKENEAPSFTFYGNEVQDKQQIQDKTYYTLSALIKDFKEKAKDNLIFVRRVSPQEHVEALTPSWKNFNEFKVKCYFLPKNKF